MPEIMSTTKANSFLLSIVTVILFISFSADCLSNSLYDTYSNKTSVDTGWDQVPVILSRIHVPVFPDRKINIVDIGAPLNGTTIATAYIQKAIDSCSALGGGKVVIPAGTFLTGAITLKSNVNLYISSGAILKFSTNTANYLPVVLTRFEGVECYNFSPFIYSNGAGNIAVTGSGTLDGQASNSNWWAWKYSSQATTDNTNLNQMGENGTPVNQRIFGAGHQLRPVFIQFYNSQNILIDSITVINSPMWEINPVLCRNITVQNINVNSYGPNNDGCNPECCKDVWINKCTFNTGDDCIAIKSGRNNDGRRVNVASENIVIQNCNMKDGHGAITMGSECSGNIRNVFAENCTMNSANLGTILRFKTNSIRGGIIENVFMRNCTIGQISTGDILDVNMNYQEGDIGNFTPVIRNIQIENCTSVSSLKALNVVAYQRSPLTDIKIKDCSFNNASSLGTLTNICRMQVYNSFINGTVPLIPSSTAGYTEAGAYSNKASWGWSNVVTGYNGNGYMEFADSSNEIEWKIIRTQNEMDTIHFRYSNPESVNKPCVILVNGKNEGEILFSTVQSGWSNAKKIIPLSKGMNTVKLISLSSKPGAYIDRFSLTASPVLFLSSDTAVLCPGDNIFFTNGNSGGGTFQWQINSGNGYSNMLSDAVFTGITDDTLYLNDPPTSLYGSTFRCLENGIATGREFVLRFATNWTGAIDTAWERPANWSCGVLPDANTDVLINAGITHYPVVGSSTSCRSVQVYGSVSGVTVLSGAVLTLTGKK